MAQDKALARTQTGALATDNHREQLLRNLVLKGANEDQFQLVMNICNRYGFDPLLKHVVLISGTLYVTRDGLIDNAHRSGRFDGIEATAERDADGKWSATATVYVKGMSHPVRYTAYQPEHENKQSQAWQKSPRAMTVKCAEVMALKRAFNVSIGTAEEIGHDEPAPAEWRMAASESPRQVIEATVVDGQVVTDDGEIVGQLQRQGDEPDAVLMGEFTRRLANADDMDELKAVSEWAARVGLVQAPAVAAYKARKRELRAAAKPDADVEQPELIEV